MSSGNDATRLSHAGRGMLDRRGFLSNSINGLGAIALAGMLEQQGLLAATSEPGPIRPAIRSEAPLAARSGHFPARAKQVLMIFCSGACSQLETWDYKPELIKRDGQPMPGFEKLVTFQGPSGNLAKSPYAFRPRGQSG